MCLGDRRVDLQSGNNMAAPVRAPGNSFDTQKRTLVTGFIPILSIVSCLICSSLSPALESTSIAVQFRHTPSNSRQRYLSNSLSNVRVIPSGGEKKIHYSSGTCLSIFNPEGFSNPLNPTYSQREMNLRFCG